MNNLGFGLGPSMCGESLTHRKFLPGFAAAPPFILMIQITRDKPCYYLTSVTHDRLPIFQKDLIKQIVCDALNEARKSSEILIFAYVIMPDHSHIVTDGHRGISDVLRFTNGIAAKRVLDYLKENEFESSLRKLRQEEKRKGYKYSVWEHHPNAFRISGEDTFMQKLITFIKIPFVQDLSSVQKNIAFRALVCGKEILWMMSHSSPITNL